MPLKRKVNWALSVDRNKASFLTHLRALCSILYGPNGVTSILLRMNAPGLWGFLLIVPEQGGNSSKSRPLFSNLLLVMTL